jgi:hypothetical protein
MNRVIDYAPSGRGLNPGGLVVSDMTTPLRGAAHDAGAMAYRGVEGSASRLGSLGYADKASRMNRLARSGARVGQAAAIHGPALAGLGAAAVQSQLPETQTNIPNQGMSGSALGQGGMGDMAGARHGVNPERQIWSGALEQSRIATGENMTLGDRLLKEAQERMDKAHCGTMKADGCPGCPKCEGDNKKKAKKPAHGMVIVIGSKAGPGPSKDGKREKLDSDKDDKKE